MQLRAFGLVVVHVLHQPGILTGRCAQDLREGARCEHNLACQLGKEIQPGGFLWEKAQLHVWLPVFGKEVHGSFLPGV